MYETGWDPYCYPGTNVLRNQRNIRDEAELAAFEAVMSARRAAEPLPRVPRRGPTYSHYLAIHRHLFQDVYVWAGRLRTVDLKKGQSPFCRAQFVDRELHRIFESLAGDNFLQDLEANDFATRAASVLGTLNAIHPFREGNGRTQNAFLDLLASRAGHPLDLGRIATEALDVIGPMIASFDGREQPLAELIIALMRRSR